MASTEDRLRQLVDENLEVEGRAIGQELNLGGNLMDAGVSSVDFVAFMKVVASEFGVSMEPGDCEGFQTLGDLVAFLDAKAA